MASYHHETGNWSGPYKAGVSALGKDPNWKIDNHGKPAMIIDDDGYIHLVFGGHGGMPSHGENPLGNYHLGEMKHVVTKKPLDITSWEELDNVVDREAREDATIYAKKRRRSHFSVVDLRRVSATI